MAETAARNAPRAARTAKGEATRERVLESAATLFSEHGFDATSVESIAAAAGITAAGMYRHFPTKDALLLAVAERATRTSAARRALGAGQLSTELAALFAEYTAPGQTVRRRLSIELSRAAARNDAISQGLTRYNALLRESLEGTIRRAHPGLDADPAEAALLAHLLLVVLMGAIHLDTLDAERIGDRDFIADLERRFAALFAGTGSTNRSPDVRPALTSASRDLDEDDEPSDGRRRRTVRTRRRVLESAAELFALHGYDATTTEMIAERAGITVPGLYRHMDSKEALLAAVGRRTFARYRVIGPLGERDRIVTELAELVIAFGGSTDRISRRLAVELDFGAWRSDPLAQLLRDFHRQVRRNVAQSLLDGDVHQHPGHAERAALVFLMLFMGVAHLDTVDPELVDDPAWAEFLHRRMPQLVGVTC